MKIIPIQEAYKRLFKRQSEIPELELHASGHCAHIGKLSPGCLNCFVPDSFQQNIVPTNYPDSSNSCQMSCKYCPDNKEARLKSSSIGDPLEIDPFMAEHLKENFNGKTIPSLSFSGSGEPILQIKIIEGFIKYYKEKVEPLIKKPIWIRIYTNGVAFTEDTAKKCRDMGFDEIRFHLGATNFSDLVYKNMITTAKHINTITVETPSWPLHRKKLFEMLPRIEDIGVQHLNIGQVELTEFNRDRIIEAYPEAEFFQIISYQLDDGGLVYDLMKEIVKRNYSYSILDCSGLVKKIQRAGDFYRTIELGHDATDIEDWVDWDKWRNK